MTIETITNKYFQVISKKSSDWQLASGQTGTTYKIAIQPQEQDDDDVEKVKVVNAEIYATIKKGGIYKFIGSCNVNNGRMSEWRISDIAEVLEE